MANMFSGNNETQIPKNLSECMKTNATVSNLHRWSERLEKWGKLIFWIIVILGIFVTIAEMIETQELRQAYRDMMEQYIELPSEWEVFFNKLLTWAFYAFLEYCAYHVLALLISALASITQNTIITANVSLFKASGGSAASETAPQTDTTPKSTINNMPPRTYNRPPTPRPNMWECKHCLTYNKNEYGQCKNCGKFRSS